jgi:perosamine synthetase
MGTRPVVTAGFWTDASWLTARQECPLFDRVSAYLPPIATTFEGRERVRQLSSSYQEHHYELFFYGLVRALRPERCVEIGVLEGFSLLATAAGLRDNAHGHVTAYDLFERYPYRHATATRVAETCEEWSVQPFVTLHQADVHVAASRHDRVDLLHVDISNDGDIIRQQFVRWADKVTGVMVFEGGSRERDRVPWMTTHHRAATNSAVEELRREYRGWYFIVLEPFPSMTVAVRIQPAPVLNIPLHQPRVDAAAEDGVRSVLRSRWIGQGAEVRRFEDAVAAARGGPRPVAVNAASSAVRIALAIAGVGSGDEVITTPQCCTAANHPILEQSATPVFADIDYETGNLDASDVRHRVTERTKALLAVDLGGYPCAAHDLIAIAREHGLAFIEDASDAFGATYRGRPVGADSRFTVLSFGAVQLVTAGEGGMLCCPDEDDEATARRRRWYGIDRDRRVPTPDGYYAFDIVEPGYGCHLTNIAAAVGLANLRAWAECLARRRAIAACYRARLAAVPGVTLFRDVDDGEHGYQLFTIHVDNRPAFCEMLRARGIECSIAHARNDLYTVFGGRRHDLPNADRYERTNISIPLHDHLTDEQIDRILTAIAAGW